MGKVKFGLKNVKYAIWTEGTGNTAGSYGPWKVLTPGAVSLTADIEADSTDFYAEDTVYAVIDSVAKESGTIEIAFLPEEVKQDLFGYTVDSTTKLTYLTSDPKDIHVALGYETSYNDGTKCRGMRYDVTFSPFSESANTMQETTDPETITLNYTPVGKKFTIGEGANATDVNILKAHVNSGTGEAGADESVYTNFFRAVQIPGQAVVTG